MDSPSNRNLQTAQRLDHGAIAQLAEHVRSEVAAHLARSPRLNRDAVLRAVLQRTAVAALGSPVMVRAYALACYEDAIEVAVAAAKRSAR